VRLSLKNVAVSEAWFNRLVTGAIALGFLALLATGLTAYLSVRENQFHSSRVNHSFQVERAITDFLGAMDRAEAGRRGYLLTGVAAHAETFRDARKRLGTPGPWLAIMVAMAVMAPHLIWLVQNDFLPFGYAEARAAQFKKATDYLVKPAGFLLSQVGFLLPSLLIATPYLRNDVHAPETAEKSELEMLASEFDRRIVTLLAFGPMTTFASEGRAVRMALRRSLTYCRTAALLRAFSRIT